MGIMDNVPRRGGIDQPILHWRPLDCTCQLQGFRRKQAVGQIKSPPTLLARCAAALTALGEVARVKVLRGIAAKAF